MIKRIAGIAAAVVVIAGFMIGAARAADLSQAVILVASQDLDDSPLAQAVVVAAPLPNGGHLGFIVNRPTKVTLEALFPAQASARSVKEPVYLGGPVLPGALFALMRGVPDGRSAIPLMPGVVAVFDVGGIEGAVLAGAAGTFIGAHTAVGIPKDSVLRYQRALKANKVLLVANGDAREVKRAHEVLDGTGLAAFDADHIPLAPADRAAEEPAQESAGATV